MRKRASLLGVLCFAIALAFGQNPRRITGKVTDESGPVPFSTITETNSNNTVTSDANGNFSISITGNQITVSAVDHTPQTITVTGEAVAVTLARATGQLQEVVVTALGIRRSRNQVPYAAQQIPGSEVSKERNANFISNLEGKISGLDIRQTNTLGGSTNAVIRGFKSITGSNQALIVVDGVPFNNANINSANQQTGRGGFDYGSAGADMNPDDIESVTVLKGAAASALYGSQGANGVIVISTKKGARGLGITVNSGITMSSIDKSTIPKYQKLYGGGYGQYYEDTSGNFLFRDPAAGFANTGSPSSVLVVPMSEDASYGHVFDPNLMVYQWDAFDTSSPFFGKPRPWVAAANDPSKFFEKPVSYNESIFVSGGSDKGTFKLGYTRNGDRGILPNSHVDKNLFDLSGSLNVTSKLTAGATLNFSNIEGLGRYGTGYDDKNVMTNFRQWWEMNVDVKEQKEAYFRHRDNVTWNWTDP
ncbi:MAG TPA: TonB-dependent receptor plug domain-containing protein, partial [Chitinophagaceae bacterium]